MPYMETRLELRLPKELLAAIDEARGGVPRARWLREAASAYLASDGPKEVHRVVAPPAQPTCKHSEYRQLKVYAGEMCDNCGALTKEAT